jgi:hypothetical protein
MSQVSIPITTGENWISFPEDSSDNLSTIFTKSGIANSISTVYQYNSITSGYEITSLQSLVIEGRGYHIIASGNGTISYMGTPYKRKLTFDILSQSLMRGWNLIGTDNNTIDISNNSWCKVTDAQANFAVTELVPGKAYWIYSEDCNRPMLGLDMLTKVSIVGVLITGYVVFGDDIRNFLRGRKRNNVGMSESERKRKKKLEMLI